MGVFLAADEDREQHDRAGLGAGPIHPAFFWSLRLIAKDAHDFYSTPDIEQITGCRREIFQGRDAFRWPDGIWFQMVHPADREAYLAGWMCLQRGQPMLIEHRIVCSGDRTRWVVSRAAAEPDKKGLRIAGIVTEITEQKRAEEEHARLQAAIQKGAHEWRLMFDAVESPILILDPDARVKRMNRAARRLVGRNYDEVQGIPVQSIGPGALWRKAAETIAMVRSAGSAVSAEAFDQPSGRAWEISAALFTGSGIGDRITLVARDITDRKAIEEALRQSERDYRGLFENAHDAIVIFAPEGERVLEVNQRACEMYGFTRDEFIGMSMESISKNTGNGKVQIRATLDSPCHHFETIHYKSDGTEIFLEVNSSAVAYQERIAILSISRDITERKKAETALQSSEERFSVAFHSSPSAMVMATLPEWRIMSANKSFLQLSGYNREELVGRSAAELNLWARPDDRANIVRMIEEKQALSGLEVILRKKSGEVAAISLFTEIIELAGQRCFLSSMYDITEHKRAEAELKRSEERYRLLFDSNPHPMWVFDLETLNFLAVNESAVDYYGYTRDEFLEMTIKDIRPPEEVAALVDFLNEFETKLDGAGIWKHRKKDGKIVDMEVTSQPLTFAGRPARLVLASDITERRRAEEALREREIHFRSLIENASDIITILTADGTIRYESPSVERLLGYSPDELLGKNVFDIIHPDDAAGAVNSLVKATENGGTGQTIEIRVSHKDGTWRTLEAIVNNRLGDASAAGIIVNSRDITERKVVEEQLLHDALHDALTGLPNRALFMDRLGQSIKRAKKHTGYQFAVLFLDLDRFKVINDGLGHMMGDQLLVAIARRLETCLRPADTIARHGGDEFTILVDDLDEDCNATGVAEHIQSELAEPFSLCGHKIHVTASIGIALGATGYDLPEDVLRDADTAMYRAKAQGRSCSRVFDKHMHARAMTLLRLETDLWQALDQDQLMIYYQPILSLEDCRLTGFEALLRWRHPQRGLVVPSEFIPLAEETKLILPIGRWAIKEACRQAREWQTKFPASDRLSISVNLSGKQLMQPDLIEQIESALAETGLDATSLKLEITESVFMENVESTIAMLLQLRALGVQLHIDDFGTGYSSLSYLHQFPVDSLKIDRSFVSSMSADRKNSEIVRTVVSLARRLGISATAEGIETAEQLAELRALGCDNGQGYLFSEAVDANAASGLIARESRRGRARWPKLLGLRGREQTEPGLPLAPAVPTGPPGGSDAATGPSSHYEVEPYRTGHLRGVA